MRNINYAEFPVYESGSGRRMVNKEQLPFPDTTTELQAQNAKLRKKLKAYEFIADVKYRVDTWMQCLQNGHNWGDYGCDVCPTKYKESKLFDDKIDKLLDLLGVKKSESNN